MSTRGRLPARSADQLVEHQPTMQMLQAIAEGRIVRGDGTDQAANAPYLWDGKPPTMLLRRLAREGLVTLPLSGPPKLNGDAELLLQRWTSSSS